MKGSTTPVSAALMTNVHASGAFDIPTTKRTDPSTPEEDEALIVWLDGDLTAVAGKTESGEHDLEQLGGFVEVECMKNPHQSSCQSSKSLSGLNT